MRYLVSLLLATGSLTLVSCFPGVAITPDRKSRFIESYDPTPSLTKFGPILWSNGAKESSAGARGVWNSRNWLINIGADAKSLPTLLDTINSDLPEAIQNAGCRVVGHGSSGPTAYASYDTRYSDAHTTGVVTVGPAFPDPSSTGVIVPLRIEEQWVP